jgi:hypothetical protein
VGDLVEFFRLPEPEERVAIRVERTLKFVARQLMPAERALGGQSLIEAGIDPDTPINRAAIQMIRGWAHSPDGIMGYMAQWGLLEQEVVVVHHIKVFVDGELAHEEDLV